VAVIRKGAAQGGALCFTRGQNQLCRGCWTGQFATA
jgi:hypothetical protein